MALTKPRTIQQSFDGAYPTTTSAKMKGGGARIYFGSMVDVTSTGFAVAAATSTTQKMAGLLKSGNNPGIPGPFIQNDGSDGDIEITLSWGAYKMENDAGDPVTIADLENLVYVTDGKTVSRTDGTGTKHPAGVMVGLDAATDQGGAGVWVRLGVAQIVAP
jgi:hypothetical protein